MSFINFFLNLGLGVLIIGSACEGWEEQDQMESGILDQNQVLEEPHSVVEVTWERGKPVLSDSSELLDYYRTQKLVRPCTYTPSRYFGGGRKYYPSDEVKQKRYMGMEIPEFITKNDGSSVGGSAGVSGGTTQRGMKQKLLSSG